MHSSTPLEATPLAAAPLAAAPLAATAAEATGPGDTPPDEAPRLLAVVADPVRWRLLAALSDGGTRCVCELQAIAPVAPNLLSYHLKVLRDAGLVSASRRGRWIDYTLVDAAADRLRAALPITARGDR